MGTVVFLSGLPSTPHLLAESSPGAGPATKTAALVDLLRGEGRKPRQWLTEDASSSPLLRIWSNVWQRDSWQRESHGETREDTDNNHGCLETASMSGEVWRARRRETARAGLKPAGLSNELSDPHLEPSAEALLVADF